MTRPDLDAQAYWHRLRKDRASNLAVAALILAAAATTLAVLDVLLTPSRQSDRSNPFYWALVLPIAWWGTGLSSFTRWATRTMRPAAVAIPLLCASTLFFVMRSGSPYALTLAALVVAGTGSALCLFFLSRSLLQHEGPDRR